MAGWCGVLVLPQDQLNKDLSHPLKSPPNFWVTMPDKLRQNHYWTQIEIPQQWIWNYRWNELDPIKIYTNTFIIHLIILNAFGT